MTVLKADLTERQVAHLLIPKAQPGSPSSAAVSQAPPLEINMSDILLRTAKCIPRRHPAKSFLPDRTTDSPRPSSQVSTAPDS